MRRASRLIDHQIATPIVDHRTTLPGAARLAVEEFANSTLAVEEFANCAANWLLRRTPGSARGVTMAQGRAVPILFLLAVCAANGLEADAKKIKEKDISVITLQEGKYTTARRGSPIPQLRCLSGCSVTPKTVQCYNRGWDGESNNWECKASLAPGLSFGHLDVSCEGYDYPEDPYVTVGSCGLSYHLVGGNAYQGKGVKSREQNGGVFFNLLFWAVGILFVVYVLKTCFNNRASMGPDAYGSDGTEGRPGRPGGGQGFYGPGGGPPRGPGFRPEFYPSEGDSCGSTRARPTAPPAGQEVPGFWTGAMAGGLLGYMFGNRGGDYYGYAGNYEGAYQRQRPTASSTTWSQPSTSSSTESSGYARTSRR